MTNSIATSVQNIKKKKKLIVHKSEALVTIIHLIYLSLMRYLLKYDLI